MKDQKTALITLEATPAVLAVLGTAMGYCLNNKEDYVLHTPNGEENAQVMAEIMIRLTSLLMKEIPLLTKSEKKEKIN